MKGKYVQNKLQAGENQLDNTNSAKGFNKYPRLPCRGCIASCKNYHRCDGKLWRMTE